MFITYLHIFFSPESKRWMKSLIDMYTDQQFVLPAIEAAELHSKEYNEVYFYIFSQNPGNQFKPCVFLLKIKFKPS